jgi:hypothetical protein
MFGSFAYCHSPTGAQGLLISAKSAARNMLREGRVSGHRYESAALTM